MYKYFKDLTDEHKNALNSQLRARDLKIREQIKLKYGLETADDLWYTKMDYINTHTYSDDTLITCCPKCGRPDELNNALSDRPGSYQSRNVTYQCTSCNHYYTVNC